MAQVGINMTLKLLFFSLAASMLLGCPGFTDYNTHPSLGLLLSVGSDGSWRDFPDEIVVHSLKTKDSIRVKWDTIYSDSSRSFDVERMPFSGKASLSMVFAQSDSIRLIIDIDPNVVTYIVIQTGGECSWPKLDSAMYLGSPWIDSLYIKQSTISRNPA